MKLYAILALVCLIGLVTAEEQKSDEVEDVTKLDYHVCTKSHLTKIIHRLNILRIRCHKKTIHAKRTCNKHIKKVYKVTIHRIHHYKKRYYACRRNCYWSCKRIINYWSHRVLRRKGDEREEE